MFYRVSNTKGMGIKMIINKTIKISIFYQIQNENTWYEVSIKPQDYYDTNYYDEDEEIDIDSLPLYDHAISYISLENKSIIKNTKLYIIDETTNEQIIIKEAYWNFQKNSMVERIDLDTNENISNHEIIITTLVQEDIEKKVWEIMRFSKVKEMFNPVFHSFITEDEEKLISEEIINTNI